MAYEIGVCMGQLVGNKGVDVVIENEEGAFNVYKDSDNQLQLEKLKRSRRAPAFVQKLVDCAGNTLGEIGFHSIISERDRQILNVISIWASSTVHFAQLAMQLEAKGEESELYVRQRKLNMFLLDVAKSIFHDIVRMDTVILKVMNFAQKLVSADRASLFLVDSKTNELYARIFDVGTGDEEYANVNAAKEIRDKNGPNKFFLKPGSVLKQG